MDDVLSLMPDWDAALALPALVRSGSTRQSDYRRAIREGRKPAPASDARTRRFAGVDGEGAGTDELGRQHYLYLRAADRELHTGRALTTRECLGFIVSLDREPIHAGFSFGYDTTQILRDLPKATLDRLFMSREERMAQGHGSYVYHDRYAIDYLPRNYLRVARLDVETNRIIPHSSRTIYETFGFFQCSFAKALQQFKIGTDEERAIIDRNKSRRAAFDGIGGEERRYCALECDLLARLMERFREVCHAAGIRPRTWNGAGKLAAALHTSHKTIRRGQLMLEPACMQTAAAAYYGGHFEITRTGRIEGPIYEYDINSAYPAAMLGLPCLTHGRWEKIPGRPARGLWVGDVTFRHPADANLCGLPIRTKQGRLYWPRHGGGIYWSCEVEAAEELGTRCAIGECWHYHRACDCKLFAWVRDLYEYRKKIGKGAEGYPIKLGINSLYGQLARRAGGGGPWSNPLWAGLITATTRAALLRAAAHNPDAIVMLATDGIYSAAPLPLDVGGSLGQWEAAEHPGMFVVQPGLYWGPPKPKTRGISPSFFREHIPAFEQVWRDFMSHPAGDYLTRFDDLPAHTVTVNNFTGIKLAWSRGKPETAGRWSQDERTISFDWSVKRELHSAIADGGCVRHFPHAGSKSLRSVVYSPAEATHSLARELGDLTEGMPGFMSFSPPGFE